jgi:Spy/CpxP family protein refolding chaperone
MMGGKHAGGMMGMMSSFGPSPSLILKQKEALKLTDSQVTQLEAIKEDIGKARAAHMERAQPLKKQLTEVMKGESPDLSKYESALKKMAEEQVKMQVAMARFSQKALNVLNAEQRSNVRYGMHLMRGMMGGGMMKSGGQGCPMMGSMGGGEKN